jgi:foldase protein PrsA
MSRTHRVVAALGTAALCTSLAACSGGGSGGNVAAVNGQAITRADFDHKLESSPAAKQVLNQLVQQSLIDQYARDKKIDVSQADIDKKETETKAKFPPGQFEQIVKNQGLTEQDVQQILRQQLILEKAVAPQVHVSDADVKAYFDKNHAVFDKPAQVKARHILVADQAKANEVLAKLKAGGSWDALAKQYSTDPASKDKGGELGYFGRGQMVPQFQDAAFGAKVGQIVGPIKSPFGYHIIQVEDKKPAVKATLASTSDQIKQQLTQQQEQQQYPVFLQQLRGAAKIEVYDDRYKDLFPPVTAVPSGAPAAASAAPAPATAAPAPAATK